MRITDYSLIADLADKPRRILNYVLYILKILKSKLLLLFSAWPKYLAPRHPQKTVPPLGRVTTSNWRTAWALLGWSRGLEQSWDTTPPPRPRIFWNTTLRLGKASKMPPLAQMIYYILAMVLLAPTCTFSALWGGTIASRRRSGAAACTLSLHPSYHLVILLRWGIHPPTPRAQGEIFTLSDVDPASGCMLSGRLGLLGVAVSHMAPRTFGVNFLKLLRRPTRVSDGPKEVLLPS